MLFIILEKNLKTDDIKVHSVYDDEEFAVSSLNTLIESSDEETFGYKMDSVGGIG